MKPIYAEIALPQDQQETDPRTGKPAHSVTINLAESPLGWLRARGMVTDRQFAAGELIRRDYETALLGPRVTMQWSNFSRDGYRRGAHDHGSATIAQIAAKQRFDKAVAAVGPGLADIVWRVICAGESVPCAEKALKWPARAGRLVLTLALDRVADHYCVP